MKVHVEPLPDAADAASRQAAARTLTKKIKDVVGISVEIVAADPGGVERSQGKARRVVDNRARG